MYSEQPHPLLAQVPLAVSPLVSLPTSTTLPYTYRTLPSALPPSTVDSASTTTASGEDKRPRFIISSSGHAARPDDIILSCATLSNHLNKLQSEAEQRLGEWQRAIAARELAEKRRVAPGWLDSEAKLLEPERRTTTASGSAQTSVSENSLPSAQELTNTSSQTDEGEQLDRAFGSISIR